MQYFKSELLENIDHIKHGFFTRGGGVSTGVYQGLNVGMLTEDNPEHVFENRRRIEHEIGGRLMSVHQVHSANVVTVTHDNQWPNTGANADDRPKADALVTDCPDLALGVITADCLPVLFACRSAGIIGAAHAGWQGALSGVVENTVQAMCDLGAEVSDITIALGPCIQASSYEVRGEFAKPFLEQDWENQKYFYPTKGKPDHLQFSLPDYVAGRILKQFPDMAQRPALERLDRDTYSNPDMFFSHRRRCHENPDNPQTGRQMSVIRLVK